MRVPILAVVCALVSVLLWSCQPDRAGPTGPARPPAAKFVVSATVAPDPGATDFPPFGDWKPFHVSINLSDLNPVRVRVNPADLAPARVLEIATGSSPPSYDYCGNGAEWNDYRTVRADRPVYLAACQAGPAVLVVETGSGTRIDTLLFEVVALAEEPAFNIELVFVDPAVFTKEQRGVFEQAARRWEAVIAEDIPDVDLSQPGETFDSREHQDWWDAWDGDANLGALRVEDEVDDLRVFVGRPLSGPDKPWGKGGAFWPRTGSSLPILASLEIHEDLLEAAYLYNGGLLSTIEHELAHCLGFAGWMWNELGLLGLSARETPYRDTYFAGVGARAAFHWAGGGSYRGNRVPVENDPAKGGLDSHWRETVFGNELMSTWPLLGQGQSLSRITIQSLADIGYRVDVTQADPYTLPTQPAAPSPS